MAGTPCAQVYGGAEYGGADYEAELAVITRKDCKDVTFDWSIGVVGWLRGSCPNREQFMRHCTRAAVVNTSWWCEKSWLAQ